MYASAGVSYSTVSSSNSVGIFLFWDERREKQAGVLKTHSELVIRS